MRIELCTRQTEHASAALLELEPREWHTRIRGDQPLVTVADLDEQRTVRREVRGGLSEDPPRDRKAIRPGAQRDVRLSQVFSGQSSHLRVADIGRVRDD